MTSGGCTHPVLYSGKCRDCGQIMYPASGDALNASRATRERVQAMLEQLKADAVMSKFCTAEECRAYRSAVEDMLTMLRAVPLAPSAAEGCMDKSSTQLAPSTEAVASGETPRSDAAARAVELAAESGSLVRMQEAFTALGVLNKQLESELAETCAKYERLQQSAVGWQQRIEELTSAPSSIGASSGETPRVNRLLYIGRLRQNDGYYTEGGEWVKAEDARQLERELAEANQYAEHLKECGREVARSARASTSAKKLVLDLLDNFADDDPVEDVRQAIMLWPDDDNAPASTRNDIK